MSTACEAHGPAGSTCHKPQGHDGDHAGDGLTWTKGWMA